MSTVEMSGVEPVQVNGTEAAAPAPPEVSMSPKPPAPPKVAKAEKSGHRTPRVNPGSPKGTVRKKGPRQIAARPAEVKEPKAPKAAAKAAKPAPKAPAPPPPAAKAKKKGGAIPAAKMTTYRRVAQQLKQVSDGTRLAVIDNLLQLGEAHVGQICDLLGQSQPAVSHHLALLRHGSVVEPRRDGKNNFYRLTPEGKNLATIVNKQVEKMENA